MCFGGGVSTDYTAQNEQIAQADQAKQADAKRTASINQGMDQISHLFGSGETWGPTGKTVQIANPAKSDTAARDVSGFGPLLDAGWKEVGGAANDPNVPDTIDSPEMGWNKTGTAFDDTYFNNYKQAYIDNYTPQLQDQFIKARDNLTYSLAAAGLSNSTVAGQKFGDLDATNRIAAANIANQAGGAVNDLQAKVNQAKTDLTSELQSTADPTATATDALGRAQVLGSTAPVYSPLGDLFSSVVGNVGTVANALQQRALLANYGGVPSFGTNNASSPLVK